MKLLNRWLIYLNQDVTRLVIPECQNKIPDLYRHRIVKGSPTLDLDLGISYKTHFPYPSSHIVMC